MRFRVGEPLVLRRTRFSIASRPARFFDQFDGMYDPNLETTSRDDLGLRYVDTWGDAMNAFEA